MSEKVDDLTNFAERILILQSQGQGLLSALVILKQTLGVESPHSVNICPSFLVEGGVPEVGFVSASLPPRPELPVFKCLQDKNIVSFIQSLIKKGVDTGDMSKVLSRVFTSRLNSRFNGTAHFLERQLT